MTVAPSVRARPASTAGSSSSDVPAAQHVHELAARRHVAAGVAHRVELIGRRDELRQRRRRHRAAPRTAPPRANRPGRAPSGTAARRAPGCRSALTHISYFACRSSRCQRALRKLNVCTPSANTLISCDGLSTMHRLPLPAVASACGPVGGGARHVERRRLARTARPRRCRARRRCG